jgi:hypothetical protein
MNVGSPNKMLTKLFTACSLFLATTHSTLADQTSTVKLNFYGVPGSIDTPNALSQESGTLSATFAAFNSTIKSTLAFQITPRLSGTFRYSYDKYYVRRDTSGLISENYDRSFDLRYQLMREGKYKPAVVVGIQDFLGTGIYGAEYIVATKHFGSGLRATGGIGWGRLGTHGSFSNPIWFLSDTRPNSVDSFGTLSNGTLAHNVWFRGPAALFGSVEWQPKGGKIRYEAEYSSDSYRQERSGGNTQLKLKSHFNFGVNYQVSENTSLGAYYMYGSEFGLRFSTSLHPNRPAVIGREEAPFPIRNRNQIFPQQRALFGDVIAAADVASDHIGTVPAHNIEQSPSGVRIAHVAGRCDPAAAMEIDAQQGVIDLVIFENGAGVVDCSVVTRPSGQTYVEAVSARQPVLAHGSQISDTKIDAIVSRLQKLVETDGITIGRSDISDVRAEISIRSTRFNASAQAVGRMARAMTHVLPASVEIFEIVLVQEGMAITSIKLHRSDLEALEHEADGAWKSLARAEITAAEKRSDRSVGVTGLYPKLTASLKPSVETSFFDPDNPFRFDLKARGVLRYDVSPGFSLNAIASKRIVGNVGTSTRLSDSVIQHVRSDIGLYQNAGDPTIDRLTADYMFKLSPDIYGRFSAGIFERMYGGASAELLWAPADRSIALGAEVNWVKQRDYDQLLSFRDYSTVTGHVSAYWDMGNGFASQLDVGRYLAKDWGATLAVDRVFNNGWKVGGYFTLTDVSFDDFGEGSFDKGIRIKVPLSWLTGAPTQQEYNMLIQPIYRDGGARVHIPNRLYETIRGHSPQRTKDTWGRVFR